MLWRPEIIKCQPELGRLTCTVFLRYIVTYNPVHCRDFLSEVIYMWAILMHYWFVEHMFCVCLVLSGIVNIKIIAVGRGLNHVSNVQLYNIFCGVRDSPNLCIESTDFHFFLHFLIKTKL